MRRTSSAVAFAARTAVLALPLLGVMAVGAGCTTSREHRATKAEAEFYKAQAKAHSDHATAARAEAQVYRSQLNYTARDAQEKEQALAQAQAERDRMQAEFDRLNAQYSQALADSQNPLPEALSSQLESFAAANRDLLDYDRSVGIVKFKSDVTFAPGSADLTPQAREAVKRLAQILNSGPAAGMDLMVAGHTDAQPVSRPATIQKGHKDNWYLSSHRAISVGQTLQTNGVKAHRMAMVGYADQRPVDSNATVAGRAKNRRVEILILPKGLMSAPATQTAAKPTTPTQGSTATDGDWNNNAFGWIMGSGKGKSPSATSDSGPAFSK